MSAHRHVGGGSPADVRSEPPGSDRLPVGAADVRQRVRVALRESGEDCDPRPAEDALLVASELATNAIMHGGGITGFQARVADGMLVLAISDHVAVAPVTSARLPHDYRPGGFGWPIIQRLARRVVVEPYGRTPGEGPSDAGPVGKTITVTLPLH
ncbi:ATP-binding protein [Streptomyces sp. NBC_01476]|uniref:ATP-binding protein n=1 Tax=Streptomyces sp. NBC_01476 TaxID=2903881 RepID=UPI002E34DC84|nr:ATP-binding protein [Streptomyces sp. NBC_01476]